MSVLVTLEMPCYKSVSDRSDISGANSGESLELAKNIFSSIRDTSVTQHFSTNKINTYVQTVHSKLQKMLQLKVLIVNDLSGKKVFSKILFIWPYSKSTGCKNVNFQKKYLLELAYYTVHML